MKADAVIWIPGRCWPPLPLRIYAAVTNRAESTLRYFRYGEEIPMTTRAEIEQRRKAPLRTPNNLVANTKDIAGALHALLADVFALYLKTKNFHWHVSGPHFLHYHL